MSLHEYRRKRDFAKTREPAPDDSATDSARTIFVVQLHHASRRHFDFRLQVGDALKSWAVPKGPSYDPKVKRLAVEVEDHPVSYADFEGDIGEGYGKGHVDQFDIGVWSTQGDAEAQIRKGHLKFELFGKRLKGGWHLVRSSRKERQPAWFLIKDNDAYASDIEADDLLDAKMAASTRRAARSPATKAAAKKSTARKRAPPKPKKVSQAKLIRRVAALEGARKAASSDAFFKPELARLREQPPNGPAWLHEVKWDGYRILTAIHHGKASLWSRNALPWNAKLPEIVQAIEALGLDSARLDGELIAMNDRHSDFNALQKTLSGEAQAPLVYMLFDLPYFEGYDLTRTPLHLRKSLLEEIVAGAPGHLAFSTHFLDDGDAVFAMAMEQKLEGIISKRVDSGYRAGRGDDWLKIKRLESDEFAVVGYTPAKGSRTGFGSLLLARPGPKGSWLYAGRVGTGFTDEMLRELSKTLATRGVKKPTVQIDAVDPLLRNALWVPPTAVAEVYYRGIGNQNLLRQPSLKTLRVDKRPGDLRDSDRSHGAAAKKPVKKTIARATKTTGEIVISHPDRVVFAEGKITKQEVVDYYTSVMKWFLPGVLDRPTSVIRCPAGTARPCFFQKHVMAGLSHVGTAKLKEETGAQAVYIYPNSADSIVELVQNGALEFHPWGSTVADPDRANRVVFDLDPGDDVAWKRVVSAARLVRKLLDQIGLASYVRTTGGKGLHVVIPLNPGYPWPMVKDFAHSFASTLAALHPMDFVATATKRLRHGRIYLDYLRNGRGATSVASYSLRSRPGAPVAVPLRWEELGRLKSGHDFDLRSTPKRLARLRKDPWAGIDKVRQSLDKVMTLLDDR
jgi:bifunctional non-homologous end joining protein LigD